MPENPISAFAATSFPNIPVASFAGDYFGVLFGLGSISGKLRFAKMAETALDPNLPPSPDAIFDALIKGFIDSHTAAVMLRMQGISLGFNWDNDWLNRCNKVWDGVVKAKAPVPDLSTAFNMRNRGFITEEQLKQIRQRNGETVTSFAFLRDTAKSFLNAEETITLFNRNEWSKSAAERNLKAIGGFTDNEIAKIFKLGQVIPPLADLIRFSVRDVFNPQLADKYKLFDEYDQNPDFTAWANAQGLGLMTYDDNGGNKHVADWPKYYWAAHWVQPSPQQFYEFLHRCRAGRTDRFLGIAGPLEPFTPEDLRTALKVNDYAPSVRGYLAAVSSRQLTRIDIRRAYNIGSIDRPEVTEQYLDLGYVATDAATLTKIADQAKKDYKLAEEKRRFGPYIERSTKTAVQAYSVGAIDRPTLLNALNAIYDDQEKVELIARIADLDLNVERVNVYVKSIRREFKLGLYGPLQAKRELTEAGVQDAAAQRYIDIWVRELRYPQRVAATTKIIDWYRRGLITETNANDRLQNLGWSNTDILLWLQSADQDIAKIKAREAAAKARSEKQKARAGCDVISCTEKEHKAQLAEIAKSYPISTIKRWFMLSIITEEEARTLLSAHELLPFSIDKHLEEWKIEKGSE